MDAPGYGDGLPILLDYQREWIEDRSPIAICEKSRRIGLSWADAAERVIYAAEGKGNVYYMSYNKDMTEGYIKDCEWWAARLGKAVSEITEETIIDDHGRAQTMFRMRTASGREIVALPSRPRILRSKGRPGDIAIIDEAAFCDDIDEVLKAGVAVTTWGGRVRVISTHNGADNPFNELVNDVRAGRLPYSLHRITLDDAIGDGLARRICTVKRDQWRPGYPADWRATEVAKYKTQADADEELFCIPLQGAGAWLARALIESRMVDAPIRRFAGSAAYNALPEPARRREMDTWLKEELAPLLATLTLDRRHVMGMDFARSRHLSVIAPLEIGETLRRRCPFMVEMHNVPHQQQSQVIEYVCDRLPRFAGAALDATGPGSFVAEAAVDRYRALAEGVVMTEPWYREQMPPLKAAFEDGLITIPRHDDVLEDLRAVRLIRGIPRVPEGKTDKKGERHGDSAIALALAYYASRRDGGPVEFESAGPRETAAALDGYLGESLPGLGGPHDLFAGYL